jgi:hypothetical protein
MKNFLLPYKYKFIGIFLVIVGIVLAVLYLIFDFSFTIPVFAVCSVFMETKFFTTFRTNITDELTLFILIFGFGLVAFSKEKNESKSHNDLRFFALCKAIITNIFFMLFSILFFYGGAYLGVMVFNLFSFFIFYLFFFYLSLRKKEDFERSN